MKLARDAKRPIGAEGDNWARCACCGRSAHRVRDIRHAKRCDGRSASVIAEQEPLVDRRAAENRDAKT